MKGAFIGDIVGSRFEWTGFREKEFDLFAEGCRVTDDSLMTAAVAEVFLTMRETDLPETESVLGPLLCERMRRLGRTYPDAGYGQKFKAWLMDETMGPYGSCGNGAAMRVSPAGWFAYTLAEAEELALISCRVSHNEKSAEKAAQAVAGAIFLARSGARKDVIRTYLGRFYDLSEPFDELRSHYEGEATCDGSVPQALTAFLASDSFEDALRRAVSLGGDTDTLAAISGSLAEPYFGIPASIYKIAEEYFTEEMKTVLQRFDALCEKEKD